MTGTHSYHKSQTSSTPRNPTRVSHHERKINSHCSETDNTTLDYTTGIPFSGMTNTINSKQHSTDIETLPPRASNSPHLLRSGAPGTAAPPP